MPLTPVRIGHDRLAPDFVKGDVLRGVPGRRGNRHGGKDPLRIARGPLQHLHAAHGSADHGEQRVDAEVVHKSCLRPHHVADCHHGQIRGRRAFASFRVDRWPDPVVPRQPPRTLAQMTK